MCNAVKPGEQNALEMLVKLFDWLDGLEPRGTTEIVTESQPTVLDPVAIDSAVRCSPGTRFYYLIFVGNRGWSNRRLANSDGLGGKRSEDSPNR